MSLLFSSKINLFAHGDEFYSFLTTLLLLSRKKVKEARGVILSAIIVVFLETFFYANVKHVS